MLNMFRPRRPMVRNYTAHYESETTAQTIEFDLGALTMSSATLTATELKPDGYVLKQLLYTPEWT